MPVYNGASTIREAIESVAAQTYPHWRLYVHDNCSADSTRAVVRQFKDERICLIEHSEFVPLWENWSRCLQSIDGDFVQLLCADDKLHPHCFGEKIKRAMLPEHAGVAMFSSNRMLIGKSGGRLFELGYARRQAAATLDDIMQKAHRVMNPIGDPATALLRAQAVGEGFQFTGRYPFFVDMELWLHALARGSLLHLPQTLSYFRVQGGTLSGSNFLKNYRDSVVFYRQCVKPFYKDSLFRYYLGYVRFSMRAVMREALYMLNR